MAGEKELLKQQQQIRYSETPDPEKMQEMADAAYDVAAGTHTWANRAEALAEYIRGDKQPIPAGKPE